MAMEATNGHVYREGSTTAGCGAVQWTTPVPLIARSPRRLEAEQAQDLFHRDLGAKPVEVDPWHDIPLSPRRAREGVPFRSLTT